MADHLSYHKMQIEPKAIITDQRGNPIQSSEYQLSSQISSSHLRSQPHETYASLSELYSKKFRLIETFEYLRKEYISPKGLLQEKDPTNFTSRKYNQWDLILEEVRWTAIDMIEQRKSKIAINAFISKKVKKSIRQRQTHESEIQYYHRLVSSELADMVNGCFEVIKKRISTESDTVTKEEEIREEIMKIEENGEAIDADKEEEMLDYDNLKVEEQKPEEKKQKRRLMTVNDEIENQITKTFKHPKARTLNGSVRKFIHDFLILEKKQPQDDMLIEEKENGVPKNLKVDKVNLVKEMQKCFSKWNKNKYSPELADAIVRLTKEQLPDLKLQREVSSTPSMMGLKDEKKRKKTSMGTIQIFPPAVEKKDVPKEVPPSVNLNIPYKRPQIDSIDSTHFNYKDLKKMKEKENSDELLYMWYDDTMNDHDFEAMFKTSIESNKHFPRSLNDLPITGFKRIIEEELTYQEEIFDPDIDKQIKAHKWDLEGYIAELQKKITPEQYKNKEQTIRAFIKNLPLEKGMSISEMLHILPFVSERSFFVYIDKIKFIKASEDNEFRSQLESIKWPMYVDFLFEKLNQTFGNKYVIIADVLNSNLLTRGTHKFVEKICEFKWLFIQANKLKKFFNCNKKRLQSYSTLVRTKKQEKEERPQNSESLHQSTQNKFKLNFFQKKFREYHDLKKESTFAETLEHSFPLLGNIKKHLNNDSAKSIYGNEPSDKRLFEPIEHLNLNRITWPETINKEHSIKRANNTPLTGNPLLKLERKSIVSSPHLNKVIEEIYNTTHAIPPQRSLIPPTGMPVGPMNPSHYPPKYPPASVPPHMMHGQFMQKGSMIPDSSMRSHSGGMIGSYPGDMYDGPTSQPNPSTQNVNPMNPHTMGRSMSIPMGQGFPGGPTGHPPNKGMIMGTSQNPMDSRGMHAGMYPQIPNVGAPNVGGNNPMLQQQQRLAYQMKNMNNMTSMNSNISNPMPNPMQNQMASMNMGGMNPSGGPGMRMNPGGPGMQQGPPNPQMDRNQMANMKKRQ